METMNLNDIMEDLRLADEAVHRFERRYGVTSEQFYSLYAAGKLDDGQHAEEFSEWAGFYRLKLRREQAFRDLSLQRVRELQVVGADGLVLLEPHNIMADAT